MPDVILNKGFTTAGTAPTAFSLFLAPQAITNFQQAGSLFYCAFGATKKNSVIVVPAMVKKFQPLKKEIKND